MNLRDHIHPVADIALATTVGTEFYLHGVLTAVSIVAAIVGIMAHLHAILVRQLDRDSRWEARLKAYKLQCFREWERKRDLEL